MKLEIIDLLEKLNVNFNGELILDDVSAYTDKILQYAHIECVYLEKRLIAFLAYYDNDPKQEKAYLSMIAVHNDFVGNGYGNELMLKAIKSLIQKGFKYFELEVLKSNLRAIEFYKKFNFQIIKSNSELKYLMKKRLI